MSNRLRVNITNYVDPKLQELIDKAEKDNNHLDAPYCWCEPELNFVDEETHAKVWVHKDTTQEGLN